MKACLLTRVPILINRQGIKEREDSERGGTIILNISVKGGRWIEGRAIIRGNTVTNLYLWKQVMAVNIVKEETELSGPHNVASKKKSPFNDWHCIWHIYCDLTVNWLWKSLKSRQYQNNKTIANLTVSFYLVSSSFLYIHCNTYTH